MNMAGNKPTISKPPKATGGRGRIPDIEQRRVRVMLKQAKDRTEMEGSDVPDTEFKVCDPQADENVSVIDATKKPKMETYMRNRVELELQAQAALAELEGETYKIIVGETDKSKQNPINHLGDPDGAGDAAMQLYLDIVQTAIKRVAGINGSRNIASYMVRVSDSSDEGVFAIGGITLPESPQVQFREALNMIYREVDLTDERYSYTVTIGEREFKLNLEAFSRVLRHPNVVKACDFKVSDPIPIESDSRRGFATEAIRRLGNEEVWFRDELPECLKTNGGEPEVNTPFKSNLVKQGETRTMHGMFVEIKLTLPEGAKMPLLALTEDVRDGKRLVKRGTRKGFAEIFSGNTGMRGLNTFVGKPVANGYMSAIAHAMGDLAEAGVKVVPISGSHLQYWLSAPAGEETAEMVREAISRRINAPEATEDHKYMSLELTPRVAWMDATQRDLDDVRARFILDSLEKQHYPVQMLARTDFLLNFIEYLNQAVQDDIFGQLALERNGRAPIEVEDLDNIGMIRYMCSRRKFIRDTEGLIWTLREDYFDESDPQRGKLHAKINANRDNLEDWVFKFAWERYDKLRLLLTERIEKEMKRL